MDWIVYGGTALIVVLLVIKEIAWHRLPNRHWLNQNLRDGNGDVGTPDMSGGGDGCGGD